MSLNSVLSFNQVGIKRKKWIWKDISFKVYQGESFVIIGRSGIGKSVLLKTAVSLLNHDQGEIELLNQPLSKISSKRFSQLLKEISFVFQGSALFDSFTVLENILYQYYFTNQKFDQKIKNRALDLLERVGLKGHENKQPNELSGGMQKRVAIARALLSEPKILFLDEPTTGLDPKTGVQIINLIKKIKSPHQTFISVTHDYKYITQIGEKIGFLEPEKISIFYGLQELLNTKENGIQNYLQALNAFEVKSC